MAKDELEFETLGWEEHAHQMLILAKNLDKKYALAYTAAIAKELKKAMKGNIARGDAMSRRHTDWPKPAWKAIETKRLTKKAKTKHGDIGHRVGLFGKDWAARGAWLERGYEWVAPSRKEVRPQMPALGKTGIANKLQRDAKRAAKKIENSKKP